MPTPVQALVWMPKGINTGAFSRKCEIPFAGPVPQRLWTLIGETDESRPPVLPLTPTHNQNAFLEDRIHDWDVARGKLRYYSRTSDGGIWLLLETPTRDN